MTDNFVKIITGDGFVRGFALNSTEIVERARQIHSTAPVVTAALGRTLTATSMMGTMLKDENCAITVQIKGDGPIGSILCVSDFSGNVRGYAANPLVDLPLNGLGKLDVAGGVGRSGFLNIIKDLGLREPYVGQVPIVSGEIAEDITHYFAVSEQVPTVTALGVLVDRDYSVKAAGGYILQLMPNADESAIEKLERAVAKVKPVSTLIDEGKTPAEILRALLCEFDVEILEQSYKEYRCNCSRERIERALISLGREELLKLAQEQQSIEVSCQFCERKYQVPADELRHFAGL
ncbi:Hsp33 family molecular chaperone HslO [Feifania hominis]|uniref:Hsp33 family molecular chaperone HslO n=1 Tax=Feifania hominis TaxID=2763660 RepID=UPI0020169918